MRLDHKEPILKGVTSSFLSRKTNLYRMCLLLAIRWASWNDLIKLYSQLFVGSGSYRARLRGFKLMPQIKSRLVQKLASADPYGFVNSRSFLVERKQETLPCLGWKSSIPRKLQMLWSPVSRNQLEVGLVSKGLAFLLTSWTDWANAKIKWAQRRLGLLWDTESFNNVALNM